MLPDTALQMHWSLGELPARLSYRSTKRLQLGEVRAQLYLPQLLCLATCFRNFLQQVWLGLIHVLKVLITLDVDCT